MMTQNYEKETELSPYQEFQKTRFGNILPDETQNEEESDGFDRLTTAEINFIFSSQNEAI